jgi:hypothetical protein
MKRRPTSDPALTKAAPPSLAGASMENFKGLSRQEIVQFVRPYLRQVVTIQSELLFRLLDEQFQVPLNLAETFEDIGNRFLDLSEMISQRHVESAEVRRKAN